MQEPTVSLEIKGLFPFVINKVTAIEINIPSKRPKNKPLVNGVPSAFFSLIVLKSSAINSIPFTFFLEH